MKTTLTIATLTLALAATPSALASHSFTDVPDTHPFHMEIGIFKDTNITTGCTATTFCPANPVLRQAMAAYVVRALGLVVRPGESTFKGLPGSRVSYLDDDASFVGTLNGALELYSGAQRALRLEGTATGSNVIGGSTVNNSTPGAFATTIGGGGESGTPNVPNRVTDSYGTVGGGAGNRRPTKVETAGTTRLGGRSPASGPTT